MDSYHNKNYIRNRFTSNLKFKISWVMKVNFPLHKVPTSLINPGHQRYLDLSHGCFEKLQCNVNDVARLRRIIKIKKKVNK